MTSTGKYFLLIVVILFFSYQLCSQPTEKEIKQKIELLPKINLQQAERYFFELDSMLDSFSKNADTLSNFFVFSDLLAQKSLQANHTHIYIMASGMIGCMHIKFNDNSRKGCEMIENSLNSSKDWLSPALSAYWRLMLARGYHYDEYNSISLENYEISCKEYLKAKDNLGWIVASSEFAGILYQSHHYQTAREVLMAILKTDIKEKKEHFVNLHNTLGLIELKLLNINQAIEQFNLALDLARNYKKEWIGLIHGNLGLCYQKQGKISKAIDMLNIDVNMSIQFRQYESALKALITITDIYLSQKQLAQAKIYFDSLMFLTTRLADDDLTQNYPEYYLFCTRYYRALGQYDKAIENYELYIRYKDSLAIKKNQQQINQLEIKHRMAERDAKILILEQQRELEAKAKTIRSYTWLVIGILLIVMLAFIVWLSRQTAIIRQKNVILEQQKKELRLQAERLTETNAVKDKLFSIISHDLRSPFQSMIGIIALFDAKALSNAEITQFMKQIKVIMQGLYESLSNLLEWSKSQMQGAERKNELVNINLIIELQINMLNAQAQSKDITIKNITPDKTLCVQGDSEQLSFVVRNLLANAIKFTHTGGKITLCVEQQAHETVISVQDNGVGMSAEQIDGIFRKGIKTSTRGTLSEKGTGLGLMLTKEFTEAHGGRMEIKSEVGKGSTFYIILPKA